MDACPLFISSFLFYILNCMRFVIFMLYICMYECTLYVCTYVLKFITIKFENNKYIIQLDLVKKMKKLKY